MKFVIDPKAYQVRLIDAEAFHDWIDKVRSPMQALDTEGTGQPLWQVKCAFECEELRTGDHVTVKVPAVAKPDYKYGAELVFEGLVIDTYATRTGTLKVTATATKIAPKSLTTPTKPASKAA